MVGYMCLEEQVDADFSRARRKALLRRMRARLRRDSASDGLLCFDDLRKIPGAMGRTHRGLRMVPVAQIGGSVGRCFEFDRDFMPAKESVGEKWKRVDRAFHRGEELPPVSLYEAVGFYFRPGWPPPSLRGPLPRRGVDRRLRDGVRRRRGRGVE
jgi:hypothetical protein